MFVIFDTDAINLDLIYRISIDSGGDSCFLCFHGDAGFPSENCFKLEFDGIEDAAPVFELIVNALARGDRIISIDVKDCDE